MTKYVTCPSCGYSNLVMERDRGDELYCKYCWHCFHPDEYDDFDADAQDDWDENWEDCIS